MLFWVKLEKRPYYAFQSLQPVYESCICEFSTTQKLESRAIFTFIFMWCLYFTYKL